MSVQTSEPQLPNFISLLAQALPQKWAAFLLSWQDLAFSLFIGALILLSALFAVHKIKLIPGKAQSLVELIAGGLDDFVCGVLGPAGRTYTPFIGTLFIYILFLNLAGLIPFIKSPTANWSTTMALALCVFVYVQYAAFKGMGFGGYFYHMMGRPKGFLAASLILPALMFFMHIVSELVRPLSLSLRLRSNIWGDDMLLAVIAGLGIKGVPLLIFSYGIAIVASVVQAVVFCLLTLIYFALVVAPEEE